MRSRPAILFWSVIAAWILLQWLLVANLPLLSEDWTHRELVGGFGSLLDCFDRSHPPPRPLQHIFFRLTGSAPAWAMRLPAFAMHFGSVVTLAWLARLAGLDAVRARMAALLFAAFPAIRSLGWPAAVSGSGHVLFELLAFVAFAGSRPGSWRAAMLVAPTLLAAIAWHPSPVLAPLMFVAWRAWVAPAGEGNALQRALRSLREPAVLAAFVVAALMLVWIVPAPGPRGGVRELGAIAANSARAAVFWLPEPARVAIVEALRGGGSARWSGLGALAMVAAAAALAWWRGGGLMRFCLFAIGIDLGLTVVKAGFSLRYAMFPSAMLALGCAGCAAARPRWLRALVLLLGLSFAVDSARDVADFVAAGKSAAVLLQSAAQLCSEVGASAPLWIVDPPPDAGAEGDIPVWNWGLRQALAARGVADVRLITTLRSVTAGTDVERVDQARIDGVLADRSAAVVRCHPGGRLEILRPGR